MDPSKSEGDRHPKVMSQKGFDDLVDSFVRMADPSRIQSAVSGWSMTIWAADYALAAQEALKRLKRRREAFEERERKR